MDTHVYSSTIQETTASSITISSELSMGGFMKIPVIRATAFWTIYGSGDIELKTQASVRETAPFLPRFGLQLIMPKGTELVEYFGYGPHESYVDKRCGTRKSKYNSTVDNLYENYMRPQESGSHYGTDWLAVTDLQGMGLLFSGVESFLFNVSHYTPEHLTNIRHNYELVKKEETIVNIDYMMSGIGSNSCGPELDTKYKFLQKTFDFCVRIKPIFKDDVVISDIIRVQYK